MKDECIKIVKNFLDRYLVDERPLVVAVSGGCDSLALLHMVLECRQFFDLDVHVAHVDHSLRAESAREAKELGTYVAKLGLSYHVKLLDGKVSGNVEDWAREKRYAFFAELSRYLESQAIMVAHHQDDQAETVLKRVFEGSHLSRLGALAQETILHGMRVWRPLLPLSKRQLESWLAKRGFRGFADPMNADVQFLRARMRHVMFPAIEQQFGKKIGPTLSRIGQRALELREYLDRRIRPYFRALRQEEGKISIDFTPFFPLEKVEVIHFLIEWAASIDIQLSHAECETCFELLKRRLPHRTIGPFSVDRGCIFWTYSAKSVTLKP